MNRAEYLRQYRIENPELAHKYYLKAKTAQRNNRLKNKYAITLKEYNQLFKAQNGLCAGCYRHQSQFKYALAVDHDHLTDRVRGLLCGPCNTTLGNVLDNPDTLRRLASYLDKQSGYRSQRLV